jgi:DNA-binding transcriptional LysR family regulator
MELRQLQALVTVARTASFTKAADELYLTQSAVTRQIAALEGELRTRLFDRLGRSAVLTSAGKALEAYAREILRLDAEAVRAVQDVSSGIAGKIALGSSSTAAAYLLPQILREFRQRNPGIELSVLTGSSQHVADLIVHNNADIGIVMDKPLDDGLNTITVAEYSIALIVYPDHPLANSALGIPKDVTLRQLAELPLILMQPGSSMRRSADDLLQQAESSHYISMELDNVEAIKKMIEARLGVSLLPLMSVTNECKSGSLVALPILSPNPPRPSIAIIHRKDKFITKTMHSFISLVSERLRVPDDSGTMK